MIIILAKDRPEMLTRSPSQDSVSLIQTLEVAEPWDGSADMNSGISMAFAALSKARDFRSEIYVVSDFTSPVELPSPQGNVIPYFVPISPESPENLSVESIDVISEIIEPGHPVEIEITLANHGLKERKDIYYSVFLDGKRVGEDVVSISAGSTIKRRQLVQPEKPGLQQGSVQIEEGDVLKADNRGYFCFSVPERLDVLLIGEESATRELHLALSAASQEQRLISIERAGTSAWDTQQLSRYDAIIFVDPVDIGQAQCSRLAQFVEQGGGLMLIPGSHMDIASVNRELLADLGTAQWGEKVGRPGSRDFFLSWKDPDLNSPLLSGIFRPGSHPSAPHFYQALRLVGDQGDAAIALSNGMPFLSESRVGSGRVILCASSPQRDWSDWAQKGIFAPLLHRLVLHLASSSKESCSKLLVGDELEVPATKAGSSTATLTYPDGQKVKLPLRALGQKVAFVEPSLNPAGIFTLETGSSTYLAAANVPTQESDLKPVNMAQRYPEWFKAGATTLKADRIAEDVRNSRYGKELWRLALIGGLIALLLESALGSSYTRQSSSESESSEKADASAN